MKGTRTKDIIYKHAHFITETGSTLEEHLKNARVKLKFARSREQKFGGDNDNIRFWNRATTRGLLYCGMFHSYENGRSQLIVAVAEQVEEYKILPAEAPKTAGSNKAEFNEGLLFFGVRGNHVLLLQSAALKVGALVDYLNWLLQDACTELDQSNRVSLADPPPKRLRDRKKVGPLKSIILSPSMHAKTTLEGEGVTKTEREKVQMDLEKTDWKLIKTALEMMNIDVPQLQRLDKDFSPELIEVSLELKWKGRKKDRVGTPILDSVMRAFQDVDDPPIIAETVDGEILKGNDLRLKKTVSLQSQGKIPVSGDVFEKMAAFLADLQQKGDITIE